MSMKQFDQQQNKPICSNCKQVNPPSWFKNRIGEVLCSRCISSNADLQKQFSNRPTHEAIFKGPGIFALSNETLTSAAWSAAMAMSKKEQSDQGRLMASLHPKQETLEEPTMAVTTSSMVLPISRSHSYTASAPVPQAEPIETPKEDEMQVVEGPETEVYTESNLDKEASPKKTSPVRDERQQSAEEESEDESVTAPVPPVTRRATRAARSKEESMLMSTGVPPMGDPATSPSFPGNGGLLSRSMSTVSNLSKTESKKKGGSSQSITKSYSASSSMTSRKGRSRKRRSSVSDEPLNRSEEVKVPKGKGRRHIFKQRGTARRAPLATATVVTGESVLHRGVYWQKGDVVSVIDSEDGLTYYAMVKGLLSDQYGQKSAVLTWLIPTVEATVGEFHPNKYILGPEDEVPRSLDVMEIVCRTPSEYYLKNSPYPIQETPTDLAYVWGPVKGSAPTLKRKDQLTSTG